MPWTPTDKDRCIHYWETSSGRRSRCPNAWNRSRCKRCDSHCLCRTRELMVERGTWNGPQDKPPAPTLLTTATSQTLTKVDQAGVSLHGDGRTTRSQNQEAEISGSEIQITDEVDELFSDIEKLYIDMEEVLSGEDDAGITDGGWRDEHRDYGAVPTSVQIYYQCGIDNGRHTRNPPEQLHRDDRLLIERYSTWMTGDLAYTLPMATSSSTYKWELTVSMEGKVWLVTDKVRRQVRNTSDLFHNEWYNMKRIQWGGRSVTARNIIHRFLEYVAQGKVRLTTDPHDNSAVYYDQPLPAPENIEVDGLTRVRFNHAANWVGQVSHLRGTIGPTQVVGKVFVPEGLHMADRYLLDQDRGCYQQGVPRGAREGADATWKLVRLDLPTEVTRGIPIYAHAFDLEDRTRIGVVIDQLSIERASTLKMRYLLVGRDAGLAYVRQDIDEGDDLDCIRFLSARVTRLPYNHPPARLVHRLCKELYEGQPKRRTISDLAEACWATERAVIESLADSSWDPGFHKATGCAVGVYRPVKKPGSVRLDNIKYSDLEDVVFSSDNDGSIYCALSMERVVITNGHVYIGGDSALKYDKLHADYLIGSPAAGLIASSQEMMRIFEDLCCAKSEGLSIVSFNYAARNVGSQSSERVT